MITFTNLSPLVSTTARISFSTKSYSFAFKRPILITISISSAPFSIASFVSNAFTRLVLAPRGNPITVQTFTSESFKASAARETQVGLTQTLAKLYSLASAIRLSI